jgi:hypothetical protein
VIDVAATPLTGNIVVHHEGGTSTSSTQLCGDLGLFEIATPSDAAGRPRIA